MKDTETTQKWCGDGDDDDKLGRETRRWKEIKITQVFGSLSVLLLKDEEEGLSGHSHTQTHLLSLLLLATVVLLLLRERELVSYHTQTITHTHI